MNLWPQTFFFIFYIILKDLYYKFLRRKSSKITIIQEIRYVCFFTALRVTDLCLRLNDDIQMTQFQFPIEKIYICILTKMLKNTTFYMRKIHHCVQRIPVDIFQY